MHFTSHTPTEHDKLIHKIILHTQWIYIDTLNPILSISETCLSSPSMD